MKAEQLSRKELAQYIDYAVLKPEITIDEMTRAAEKGIRLQVRSLCVNPIYVPLTDAMARGTETAVTPVVDFPFGCSSTASRLAQLREVLPYESVEEVDIVMSYGLLKSGRNDLVTEDLKQCAELCHSYGKQLKVILETDALTEEEIRQGCDCCISAGADFVKTSTGFLTGHELRGAANDVIDLIMAEVAGRCKVKGSGVIRTREHFLELIDKGVDRCGVNYTSVEKLLGEE